MQIAASIPLDIMPGPNDPSNFAMPQQVLTSLFLYITTICFMYDVTKCFSLMLCSFYSLYIDAFSLVLRPTTLLNPVLILILLNLMV